MNAPNFLLRYCGLPSIAVRSFGTLALLSALLLPAQAAPPVTVTVVDVPFAAIDLRQAAIEQRGVQRLHDGDASGAIESFDQLLGQNPDDTFALMDRAIAYQKLGKRQAALRDYDRAIALAPAQPLLYYNRATVHSQLGDHRGAIADYSEALRLNSEDTRSMLNCGNEHRHLNELDQAIADYNRALQMQPRYTLALHNRGRVYWLMGERQKALADYKQAAALWEQEGNSSAAATAKQALVALQKELLVGQTP